MNILDSRHFQDFKVVLSLFGQWPFQSRLKRYLARFCVLFAIFSIVTPKLIKLVEVLDDIDGIIACLPMLFVHFTSITKYFNWILNAHKYDNLIFLIKRDGEALEVDQDVEIMEDSLRKIKNISTVYTSSMFGILGIFLISPGLPKLLDVLNPLNESRPLLHIYETEYFVDRDEYYLYILLHYYMTVPVSMAVLLYFDILLGTHVFHACAMFKILRGYLKTIHVEICDGGEDIKNKLRKIVQCIDLHRNTLEFADEIDSAYSTAWFFLLIICIAGLTFTGTATVMKLNETDEAIKYVAFSLGHVFHLFFTSFQGQLLIDNSEAVFFDTYSSEWYRMPEFYKKLLITIMMRNQNPCRISAGKVGYHLAMDTFSTVIQKAMSFFTVLSSMR